MTDKKTQVEGQTGLSTCCVSALAPEVGSDFLNLAFLYPAVNDGFHHRRLSVSQTQVHQIFLCELLWERVQKADVALGGLSGQLTVVERVDLVAINLKLVVEATFSTPEGEPDGLLRFFLAFEQIGDDASSEAVEGSTTTERVE